jgi:hypothetical protein
MSERAEQGRQEQVVKSQHGPRTQDNFQNFKIITKWLGTVAQSYNPSYLGGENQEDQGSRSAWAKSSQDPISTNKSWKQWCVPVIPMMQSSLAQA